MEVLKFNDIASEQMVYDATSAALQAGDKRLLIAMARPTLLNGVVGMARDLGLDVVDIAASPVAMFNALSDLPGTSAQAPSLMIDIGQSTTQVAVGTNRTLLFARAFASGGQAFTDSAARQAKLPYLEAERVKVAQGRVAPDAPGALDQGLTAAAGLWLREVEACLALHASIMPEADARPTRVILTGGGAALRGLPEFVQARLGLPTLVAPPLLTARKAGLDRFTVVTGYCAQVLEEFLGRDVCVERRGDSSQHRRVDRARTDRVHTDTCVLHLGG